MDGLESPEIQTYAEEIINTITHGMGLLISIPATIILVLLARHHGNKWHVIACALYGCSLILMYTCSTIYHGSGISGWSADLKDFLRDLDHCAIYFLIAGTYTPLTLINLVHNNLQTPTNVHTQTNVKSILPSPSSTQNLLPRKLEKNMVVIGCSVLTIVWLICIVGVSSKLINGSDGINPILSYGSYLVMGWLCVFVARPLLKALPPTGIRLLIAGGLSYTIGVIFLLSDTLPFNHPVWHLFVSAGSILHYLSVVACSIPFGQSPWAVMERRTRSAILDWSTRFASSNLIG